MEENANTDFSYSTRVTVCAECIYVFLSNLLLDGEYHIDC